MSDDTHTSQPANPTIVPATDLYSPKGGLRVLHTSDWHIGKRLYNQERYAEFAKFLAWLTKEIDRLYVDVLVVAGDVFDTATPSNQAQELYYGFLGKVAKTACQHVIIVAGNHDSPSFLDAPKSILRSLNVQVIGQASPLGDDVHDDQLAADELLTLYDQQGQAIAIVLAVPYLRDKDVRRSHSLLEVGQKNHEAALGIKAHYQWLTERALLLRDSLAAPNIPIIATGHLFVAGSHTSSDDDGMRQLYVGTLSQISGAIFDDQLDYVALGHIHAPQRVAGRDHIRYCGSPIVMGFGELGKPKQVLIVDFVGRVPSICAHQVPSFQRLERISGDHQTIMAQLDRLIAEQTSIYLEIVYTGETLQPNLTKAIRDKLKDTQLLALNIINHTHRQYALKAIDKSENLIDLNPVQVFNRLLAQQQISPVDQPDLLQAYQDVLQTVHEDDTTDTPPHPIYPR